jgi:ribosomal protein S18 acetylase RimI-like enzyme
MAALPEPSHGSHPGNIVDLRNLSSQALRLLLEEESAAWRRDFFWDFHPSAELVKKFVDMRALTGYAMLRAGQATGYAYFVCEDDKALIGDLFVRFSPHQRQEEDALLEAMLGTLWRTPAIRRVEGQLMMLRQPFSRQMPFPDCFTLHPRRFYQADLVRVDGLAFETSTRQRIVPWSEAYQEESASLITRSYVGHIDSEINDQYRSADGALRFLTNIIQYPGCGTFCGPASFVSIDPITQRMSGMCLSSLVSETTGHITQLCVAPEHRGIGLARELLRRSLLALAARRVIRVSLTVTTLNHKAIRLYQRMGFKNQRDFAAYVWTKPRF